MKAEYRIELRNKYEIIIEELVEDLRLGLFSDSTENKDKYGNYIINLF